jgi:hypothetical protein
LGSLSLALGYNDMTSEKMLLWRFIFDFYDDDVLQGFTVSYISVKASRVIQNIVGKGIFDSLITQWIAEGSLKKVSDPFETVDENAVTFEIHNYPSDLNEENTAEQSAAANP